MILSIITYIVACLYFPILDMCTLNYSIWGINVLAGLGGTLLLYTIVSKYMKRNNIFTKLGMVTLPILCFHTLEFQTLIGSFWPLFADLSWVLQFIIRVVFSLIMVAVCKHIEFTRRLFRI